VPGVAGALRPSVRDSVRHRAREADQVTDTCSAGGEHLVAPTGSDLGGLATRRRARLCGVAAPGRRRRPPGEQLLPPRPDGVYVITKSSRDAEVIKRSDRDAGHDIP